MACNGYGVTGAGARCDDNFCRAQYIVPLLWRNKYANLLTTSRTDRRPDFTKEKSNHLDGPST